MSEVDKSMHYINFTAKSWQIGSYFGDRWKVNPKLTVDLGLRYPSLPVMSLFTFLRSIVQSVG